MSDTTDVIDRLAAIAPGSALDGVRHARPEARRHAQASYDALFAPLDDAAMGVRERAAVALFVAALHADAPAQALYADLLRHCGGAVLEEPVLVEAARAMARGPYGSYPAGPLTGENEAGPVYRVDETAQEVLGPRLAAALAHAHMLVFHPRDAAPWHLQALVQAQWSTPAIVTLSQLVAFLSFQLRVAAGLRAMAEAA